MTTMHDTLLQENVLAELLFEPSLDATHIVSVVKDGVVTLTGSVSNFPEKWAAERAVKRVFGVKGVAEELVVDFRSSTKHSDEDIVGAARRALEWSTTVPEKSVQIRVEKGWVTLEGVVDWQYQRQDAHNVVAHLLGVKGVSNMITLRPQVTSADVHTRIEAAFKRSGDLEADRVQVEVEGSKITLRGQLPNWNEIDAAGLAAWNAAGVTAVDNQIYIGR
ncbi:BON domain-containing protein [Deinococcus sp. UYEF24]